MTTESVTEREWKIVGVVGGGAMGSGIAYEVARNLDARLIVREADAHTLARARANVERLGGRAVAKGQLSRETADAWLARFSWTTDLEELAAADNVIEAVFEHLALKQEIFAKLDSVCRPEAILASNTSGLPITQIASARARAGAAFLQSRASDETGRDHPRISDQRRNRRARARFLRAAEERDRAREGLSRLHHDPHRHGGHRRGDSLPGRRHRHGRGH